MVKLPASFRVFVGLLVVLAHVAVQPGKALSHVLCIEQDGRTIVEFGAGGTCQHPSFLIDQGGAAAIAPCCEGCTDLILPAEPSPTVASKRGYAPRIVLSTGPPSEGVALAVVLEYIIPELAALKRLRVPSRVDFSDPFLIALRSVRLLT